MKKKLFNYLIAIMCNLYVFLLLFPFLGFAQNQSDINNLKRAFGELSYKEYEYRLDFNKQKKTLYLEVSKSGKAVKGYKLLVKDIHPLGVFVIDNDSICSLRLLSLNNGHVFIDENLDKKYVHSNTANYVDIGIWDKSFKPALNSFIVQFKQFIKDLTESKIKKGEEIILTNGGMNN